MRVAHVTLGLSTGGQERLLLDFARYADRTQFEPLFVSLTDRGALADELERLGGRVVTLGDAGGVRPSLVGRLRKLFRGERIDVVHTHDDRPLTYGIPAGRLAGCRVVHTQHHGKLPHVGSKQEFLVRWIGRLAHAFVTVSRDSAKHYIDAGLPSRLVRTICNGIDTDAFAFQGPLIGGPAVTVARLSPEKNIPNLIRAARLVADRDPDFRLEIAGDGPDRNHIARLIDDLGLANMVKCLGEVHDVPALLARAGLFVLPSKSEGISLTLLEAMARGLPVVATSVGGNPEVVLDGQTGILVPSDDSAALAEAILRVRSKFDDARLMGRAGRRRVEVHFDVRGMVAQYEQLYVGDAVPTLAKAVAT